MRRDFLDRNPEFSARVSGLGDTWEASIQPGKNDGLHEGVHGCRLARQTPFEPGLQAVSENAKRLGVAQAHAVKRGCK